MFILLKWRLKVNAIREGNSPYLREAPAVKRGCKENSFTLSIIEGRRVVDITPP